MIFKDHLSCRTVLYLMVVWGIGINYMVRVVPNVVLIAIVKPPQTPPSEIYCQSSLLNNTFVNDDNSNEKITYEFNWNEYEQGLMLGAYYWLHWLTEVPGGILAKRFGTKVIFGIGNISAVLLGFILPWATKYHLYASIFIRILQGLVAGVAFPSTHDMTAKWIPQDERSKFVSAYMGGGIAITITYGISGFIIQYLGWEAVFYITSVFGIIWFIFWHYIVFDSPSEHPRITDEEKKYILENIEHVTQENLKLSGIPWINIFTSSAIWISILANWSCVWGYYTLMTQAPAYFSFIHGWSIEKTGVLAGLPHVLTFAFSYTFGIICDLLLRKNKLSLTNVRKLATLVSTGGPGLMAIGLSYSGCNSGLAFFFMFTGITITGAVSSGPLANLVDLSPNYASVLLGICGFVVDVAGFLSPIIVGMLTYENQTINQWKLIFFISAINMSIGCLIYLIWGSAKELPWNNQTPKINKKNTKEIKEIELTTTIRL